MHLPGSVLGVCAFARVSSALAEPRCQPFKSTTGVYRSRHTDIRALTHISGINPTTFPTLTTISNALPARDRLSPQAHKKAQHHEMLGFTRTASGS